MSLEQLIVAALRHESVEWPADPGGALGTGLLDAAADHGVAALLAGTPAVKAWPDHVRLALRQMRRVEAAAEAVRRQELIELLDHLRRAAIPTLLLKGAAIAYTHYPQPWLRPRLDTDLLIAPPDRPRANEVLRQLGYRPGTNFDGTLVTHQFQYERANKYGLIERVDLHWKIANPHAFADAFTFEELDADAISVSALDEQARGLSDVHAFVLACLHRVAHHDNSDRLIWLYDIHLLGGSTDAEHRERIAAIAGAKHLREVCARGAADAKARFATAVPADWIDRLGATQGVREPTAVFLENGRTKTDILISDLGTLRGWRPKLRLIREHLFPPAAYMRRAYGPVRPVLLPFTYLHRMATGVGKWFRPER